MRTHRLPLTYGECRTRFRRAAAAAGLSTEAHPIDAAGPDGEVLTVDVAQIGAESPNRAIVVLSGVHGVEGFGPSVLQSELLGALSPGDLPDDAAVLLVHGVNPWGMAWWRRQNESNVDLNRNWRRSEVAPPPNPAYTELHPLACPDTPGLPSVDDLLAAAAAVVAERGLDWVRDAITSGQPDHPDGLHFTGSVTEQSNWIVEHVVTDRLGGVERLLALDLHTGHGPYGEVTYLCDGEAGPWVRQVADGGRVEISGPTTGRIAAGLADLVPDASFESTVVEFGTLDDAEQLAVTYLESWVHRHGDRAIDAHAEVVWNYRCCFSPDDPVWEEALLTAGRALLRRAVANP